MVLEADEITVFDPGTKINLAFEVVIDGLRIMLTSDPLSHNWASQYVGL
jgi:hypothetical protein